MLQFKATVWPKVASESTYEAHKFQNFLEEHPPDPPSCFCFRTASGLKLGGAWVRDLANVRPRCALASAVFWLRHCLLLKKTIKMKQNILYNTFKRLQVLFVAFKEISKRFKRKPPRRGQPLYKGQLAHPQCVLSSEVLL